jgi:transcriptional regulator with XRE-family HTH domain
MKAYYLPKLRQRRVSYRNKLGLLGMTQDALAKQAGTARSTIADLEAGRRPARQGTIEKLAGVLGCKPTDLLGKPTTRPDKSDAAQ